MTIGRIFQVAYVVDDLESAARWWGKTLKVGPFFALRNIRQAEMWHNGQPCTADYSAAFAMMGDTQIELIEQHDDKPSPYLGKAIPGLIHHVGAMTTDMDADRKRLIEAGATLVAGAVGQEGTRWEIFEGTECGALELIQAPAGAPDFAGFLTQAAKNWDGETPFITL